MRHILEIGPALKPLHHRSQEGLQLNGDETYTGIEQPKHLETKLNHEVWKMAKVQYGDRAKLIEGDRENLDGIPDESIDELVALGTHENQPTILNRI